MDKKSVNHNIDIQILKYVEGLEVDDTFLKQLEVDKTIQKKVIELKSDLYMMEKIKDSKMFNSLKKIGHIKIKNSAICNISGFTQLTPLTSRSNDNSPKIYHFQNISLIIKDDNKSINIDNIKKSLIIIKDGVEELNVSSLREYSTELESGNYNILLDDKEINIDID